MWIRCITSSSRVHPPPSVLLALHRTAVLRHDAIGQETLLNLLLRNYLHYNLYDQVGIIVRDVDTVLACSFAQTLFTNACIRCPPRLRSSSTLPHT